MNENDYFLFSLTLSYTNSIHPSILPSSVAMMYACKENRLDTIELLFNKNAKITMTNKSGLTCFHFAAQGDHIAAFELLVRLQTDLNAKLVLENADEAPKKLGEQPTEVPEAEKKKREKKKGHKKKAKDYDPAIVDILAALNQLSNKKTSALHVACEWDAVRVIQFLIDQKVELNVQDTNGEAPLHKLGRRYSFSTFRMLAKAGAKEDIKNVYNETPGDLLHDKVSY
jgi:uncharacterized protein